MNSKSSKITFVVLAFLYTIFIFQIASNASDNSDEPQFVYTKQEILSKNSILEIENDETISITGFSNVTKYLVVSPDTASAKLISEQEVSVTGKKAGHTFLHIWDSGSMVTIKLVVKHKRFRETEKSIKRIAGLENARPIKVGYSYDLWKSSSSSDYDPYKWNIHEQRHSVVASGDTPYGYLDGNFQYLFRKNREGIANDVEFINLNLENDYFKVALGDIFTSFSDATMPNTQYQGMEFSSGAKNENFKYDFVMGSTGHPYWASNLYPFGQMENRFFGLRTEIFPEKGISFFATLMNSARATYEKENVAGNLGAVGAKYSIGQYLNFETEFAKNNKNKTAWITSLILEFDKLLFKTIYRDVEVDFINLTGNTPFRGRKGLYTSASFKPCKILSFFTNFDVYQNRLNPDPDNIDKNNQDFSFSSRLLCPPTNTTFLVSFYNRDNRAQAFPVVNLGQQYEVKQIFNDVFLLGDISGYVRYTPSRYKSYTTGESSYLNKTLQAGFTVKPLKGLSLSVDEMLNMREWPVRDYSTSPRRFRAGAGYDSKIGKLPLTVRLYFGYQQDSHVDEDKLSVIIGENKLIGNAELRYEPLPYLNFYLQAQVEGITGSVNPELDRVQTDIFAGARILWDTKAIWEGHGTVKGWIFKDINRNGIKDKEDSPLKGIKISVDKKKCATTNNKGFYRIKNVLQGMRNISVDMASIPENYAATTALNADIVIKKMEVTKVNFGMAPKTIIKGFVFNDLNRNSTFDAADEVIPNVLIRLEDETTAFTDSYGYFTIHNVVPGRHTVTVDKNSLPKDLLPYGPFSRTVTAKEGETEKVEFVFYSLRVLTGRVYADVDENNRFDENEGAKGVNINVDGVTAETGEGGYYILRNLPCGKIKMILEKQNLPKGYDSEKDTIEIDLKKGKDIRENVDIKLIRKP